MVIVNAEYEVIFPPNTDIEGPLSDAFNIIGGFDMVSRASM